MGVVSSSVNPPLVDTEDLIDADGVAQILGLAQRNSVSGYQRRYPDMPRPVAVFAKGRIPIWRRSDIEAWVVVRGPITVGRPRKSQLPSTRKGQLASPRPTRPK